MDSVFLSKYQGYNICKRMTLLYEEEHIYDKQIDQETSKRFSELQISNIRSMRIIIQEKLRIAIDAIVSIRRNRKG